MLPSQIFNPVVDRLLHLNRGDRVAWLSDVWRGLHEFPDSERFDRVAILRGIAAQDAANRILYRWHNRFPVMAKALANAVPIVGAKGLFKDIPPERPIVFALMHFGPIHYAVTVALRMLLGRTVHIIHAGGETGAATGRYFADIGLVPVVTGAGSVEAVKAAMRASAPSAIIFVFDHLGRGGSGRVPFLGGTLPVPSGLAYFVEEMNAVVIAGWWEARALPRFRVAAVDQLDPALEPGERRRHFTEEMFRILEVCLREMPHAWTEWPNVSNR